MFSNWGIIYLLKSLPKLDVNTKLTEKNLPVYSRVMDQPWSLSPINSFSVVRSWLLLWHQIFYFICNKLKVARLVSFHQAKIWIGTSEKKHRHQVSNKIWPMTVKTTNLKRQLPIVMTTQSFLMPNVRYIRNIHTHH